MNDVAKSINQSLDQYLAEKMGGKKLPIVLIAALIFIGMAMGFAHNSSPAPFLDAMIPFFNLDPINDQSLINLSMSIMFVGTIPATVVGTLVEMKLGCRKLMTLSILIMAIGVLIVFPSYSSSSFALFLAGRIVYGFGFGLVFAALGSAVMKWFRPKGRAVMTTLNGIFPLLGALLSYTIFPGVCSLLGGLSESWYWGFGYSGIVLAAVAIIWAIGTNKQMDGVELAVEEEKLLGVVAAEGEKSDKNPIAWVMGTNQMRTCTLCFVCDFMMYMYIATVLPLWLMNAGEGMTAQAANTWTAIAFPVFGVIGVMAGGIGTNKAGRRKPFILFGQIIKMAGILIACLGSDFSPMVIITGVALFGIGNGLWMSALYITPTEIPGTNPSRVGAFYSFFNMFGFITGCVGPVVGGMIATAMISNSGLADEMAQIAYGYKWSVLILGLSHVLAIVAAIFYKDNGPAAKKQRAAKEAAKTAAGQ